MCERLLIFQEDLSVTRLVKIRKVKKKKKTELLYLKVKRRQIWCNETKPKNEKQQQQPQEREREGTQTTVKRDTNAAWKERPALLLWKA